MLSKFERVKSVLFNTPLAGALCYYFALPPTNLWILAFFVPFFWTRLIFREEPLKRRSVFFTGYVFWLFSIWWIACPHPATALGLIAGCAYLSLYWVLFFIASRTAVQRFKLPAAFAVPVCWVGAEYLRFHLLGGFSFCALQHSFYRVPALIQTANIGGEYLVGFFLFALGASAVTVIEKWKSINRFEYRCTIAWGLSLLAFLLFYSYGVYQLFQPIDITSAKEKDRISFTVTVLQGNIPISLTSEEDLSGKTFKQFIDLTRKVVEEHRESGAALDLIVMPETTCPIPVLEFTGTVQPADLKLTAKRAVDWKTQLQDFVNVLEIPVLFGCSTLSFKDTKTPRRLNSALLLTTNEDSFARYDKIALVMFGEYIPFSDYLPDSFFLKSLCQEAHCGNDVVAMTLPKKTVEQVQPLTFAPNICFESSLPHFIRRQVLTLRQHGNAPQFLVNISNDGWFRFSRQIDQHLAANVFRAVENGLWHITAMNGGFSAIIQPDGQIQRIGKRRQAEAVTGTIYLGANLPQTLYQRVGDTPALFCTVFLFVCLCISERRNRPAKQPLNRV